MNEQINSTLQRRTLLLVGSAKKEHESTSEALGSFLLDQLAAQDFATDTRYVHRALRTHERSAELLDTIDAADLVVLAFPLYVDSLPYLVTKALEMIAEDRQRRATPRRPQFVAIANCGFPEANHNDVALAICRCFAQEANLQWAGGLALGSGGVIGGQTLAEAGGVANIVRQALTLAADALARQQAIPEEAITLLAKPLIPYAMYTTIAGIGWRVQALKNHVYTKLNDQPLRDYQTA
ncbi:MAG: hypothetical protein U0175_14390 [Caldilineaceae bacterium]